MADNDPILLDDYREADSLSTTDYYFVRIGDPVPIKPSPFNFDPQNPPSQPLAVSERHDLIFVAHSSGFCVAWISEVMALARNIRRKGRFSTSSVLERSIVHVPLGQVRILALSFDNSTLAASVGGDVHFFSVLSLREKKLEPSFSCSLNESVKDISLNESVKDIRWRTESKNSFLVLSELGKLYHGRGGDSFEKVMDNVDAVEWSIEGICIMVAKKDNLSILSSAFKETTRIVLSFNSDANRTVKVDSIRWVHPKSIIVGCFQLTADGKEENYLVQVIRSKETDLSEPFTWKYCKPIVISCRDLFPSVIDDILPFGRGTYLLASYLKEWELAIIANKKSTDQHILCLGWSLGEKKDEVAVINIERDDWLPRIELQENDDDNFILGMCTVKSQWTEERSLMCLTVEGKLVMFVVRPKMTPELCRKEKTDMMTPFQRIRFRE